MEYKTWLDIDLCLFDGGAAAGGDGTGGITGGGTTETGPAVAGQGKATGDRGKEGASVAGKREGRRTGQGGSLDRSKGERRAAGRPGDQPEAQGKRVTALTGSEPDSPEGRKQERRKRYQELINGEFRDFYSEDTQNIINRRFKETKGLEERLGKSQPILDLLMERYGIGDGDTERLQKAIEAENADLARAAKTAGLSVEEYRRLQRFRNENRDLLDAQRQRQVREKVEVQLRQWYGEGEKLQKLYPGFDLGAEAKNPRFLALLRSGIPVRHAYEVIHMDEIKARIAAATAKNTEKQVVDAIRAKGVRPAENGTAAQSGFTVKGDVSKLTRKDRAEIARRAARGEKITF